MVVRRLRLRELHRVLVVRGKKRPPPPQLQRLHPALLTSVEPLNLRGNLLLQSRRRGRSLLSGVGLAVHASERAEIGYGKPQEPLISLAFVLLVETLRSCRRSRQ